MVNVACIGVGGAGWFDMHGVARSKKARIVAICDIDESRLERAGAAFPDAARYYDYREMLEREKSVDAVTVSTPDHTHAPASLMAMKMGKHCFCQKPLGVSIGEVREMAAVAKQSKVATQMGTQGVADSRLRQGIELIRSGVLGTIREVHVWTDRPGTFWPRGTEPSRNHRVPKQLHWEHWIGTAPYRPYNPAYHPSGWRGWTDFGTGALGDMGCHNSALAFLALELGLPESVEGKCARTKGDVFPKWSELVFDFPARGKRPAIRMFWYDGGRKPPASLFDGLRVDENGSLLVGENGRYYSAGFANRFSHLLPQDRFAAHQPSEPQLPRPESHYHEWLEGCRGGSVPLCNFIDFAADLTEVMLLGNLAMRLRKRVEWDTAEARVRNCPEADPFIRRRYREGW
jgi:predicted dehydrogenase